MARPKSLFYITQQLQHCNSIETKFDFLGNGMVTGNHDLPFHTRICHLRNSFEIQKFRIFKKKSDRTNCQMDSSSPERRRQCHSNFGMPIVNCFLYL